VSTYLLNLQKQLINRGYEVVELHLRPSHASNTEIIEGIEVHRVPREPLDKKMLQGYSKFKEAIYKECHNINSFNRPALEMPGYDEFLQINDSFGREVRDMLNKNSPDLIHIHDFQLIYLYRYVPRGTPLVFTWHIPLSKNISTHLKKYLVKHLNEYDRIIFSSPDYMEAAVGFGIEEKKCELIYPVCNTDLFNVMDVDRKRVLEKHSIPDAKLILCVQRIDPKSGHLQLIRAMPEVLKAVPDARLVFVGGSSMSNKISKDRQQYEEQVKSTVKELKLENKVIFAGNIDYGRLPEVYNASDIVALCSKVEGFGLSITEGMSCGKPILGNNVGGIPIQVKDGINGFLVSPDDVENTSKRLIRMLEDESLREEFGRESRKIVDRLFRLDLSVDRHIHTYNTLINEKHENRRLEKIDIEDVDALITDFDRTLTDSPGTLKKETVDSLSRLHTVHILATGRDFSYAKKLADKYKLWTCIVCENGSVIYFTKSKKTITINSDHMDAARNILSENNVKCTYGKVVISTSIRHMEQAEQLLSKISKNLNFVQNVDEVMILPKFINKGSGTKMALEYLGIMPEHTIVVGDAENDIDLFAIPAFRVAVANAHPRLKLIADQVTDKPSSEGIFEIVSKLLRE
jgi:L-malate glycosyltransferase